MKPFQVTFHLDGSGVYCDPAEPLHLDALLAWSLAHFHVHGEPPARDGVPEEIPIPVMQGKVGGIPVWRASALFPDGVTAEAMHFWRKRFRQSRAELSAGAPNLTNGTYRDWNMPLPVLLAPRMVAWAVGSRKEVLRVLRKNVRWLGKKRSQGHGRVVGIDAEWCDEDWSWIREGRAQRFLPFAGGMRVVRPRPPYWCGHGAVPCCEIGQEIAL